MESGETLIDDVWCPVFKGRHARSLSKPSELRWDVTK